MISRVTRVAELMGKNSRSNDCAQNTHDTIEADRNAVPSTSMSGGQDFGSVGVKRSVIDILQYDVSV